MQTCLNNSCTFCFFTTSYWFCRYFSKLQRLKEEDTELELIKFLVPDNILLDTKSLKIKITQIDKNLLSIWVISFFLSKYYREYVELKKMNFQIKTFEELNTKELYNILQLRSEVFVVEQDCVYQDIDSKDQKALHVIGYKNNKIVAYTRIFKPGDYFDNASIGRVVSSSF